MKKIIVLTATALILISSFNSAFGQLGRLSKKKRQTDTTVISNPNVENPNSEKEPIVARSKSQVEIINDRLLELKKRQSGQDIKYDKLNTAFVNLKKEVRKNQKSTIDSLQKMGKSTKEAFAIFKQEEEDFCFGLIANSTKSRDSLFSVLEARADSGDIYSENLKTSLEIKTSKASNKFLWLYIILGILTIMVSFLFFFVWKKRKSIQETIDQLNSEKNDPNHVNYRRPQREYQPVD